MTVVARARPLRRPRQGPARPARGGAVAAHPVLASAAVAGGLAALLLYAGPAGTDLPAHLYQLALYRRHGFELWDDDWYAGRIAFAGYSLLYYPLAALVGIKPLAVASVAGATAAFGALVRRLWGSAGIAAGWVFAPAAAAGVLSGAFPYLLGLALALAALLAAARRGWPAFALLELLAYAASPVAFLLGLVALAGAGLARPHRALLAPAAIVTGVCVLAFAVARAFPDQGRYPFATSELVAVLAFCLAGAALTWRVEEARVLRSLYLVYALVCVLAYALPSDLGGNAARLRLLALPLAVLTLSLRGWRPRALSLAVVALALAWNVSPLVYGAVRSEGDPSAARAYWRPVIAFLGPRLGSAYRVEVVATADHWEALYLPEAGIPIARGWFRQDDFPQNAVLYGRPTRRSYLAWLHRLGVRFVVLPDAALDYSSGAEAALLEGGASGLRLVLRTAHARVYAVPRPTPIVSGPGAPRVLARGPESLTVALARAGSYRVALRYSPYLTAPGACLRARGDGMTELVARRPGTVRIAFSFTGSRLLAALGGGRAACFAPG